MSTASTIVRHRPTRAPLTFRRGRPSHSTAMSVVVPPTSTTHASRRPARCQAPTTLAAGPDRIVSIGRRMAHSARTNEPSPLTTISGAPTPSSSRLRRTVSTSSRSRGIKRAFRATVVARRTELRRAVSSWPHVTGRDSPPGPQAVNSSISARTRSSWSGLRTLKYPDTAKASTCSRRARMACRAAVSSNGAISFPAPSCPPCR